MNKNQIEKIFRKKIQKNKFKYVGCEGSLFEPKEKKIFWCLIVTSNYT